MNLTARRTTARRVVYGDPGSGCSDNQYAQFNRQRSRPATAASASNRAATSSSDARTTRWIWRSRAISAWAARRQLQFRLDAFNAFNAVVINARVTTLQLQQPDRPDVLNSQFLADGSVDPTQLLPRNAGFGAATDAQTLRNMQVDDPVPVLAGLRPSEGLGPLRSLESPDA